MTVSTIATEIYTELGSPSSLTEVAIEYWLRSNVGVLNNSINTEFSLNSATPVEIEHEVCGVVTQIGIDEGAILKKMYMLHYYDQQIRSNISSAGTDAVIEVASDGMKVRKINKTEIAKHLGDIKRQEQEELNRLINYYKTNKANPRQVAGDDTVEGNYSSGGSTSSFNRLNY